MLNTSFLEVLGEAAWWYACYYIRDMSTKVGTMTNTSFFAAMSPAGSTLSMPLQMWHGYSWFLNDSANQYIL